MSINTPSTHPDVVDVESKAVVQGASNAATDVPTISKPADSSHVTFGTALTLCVITAIVSLTITFLGPGIATKYGFKQTAVSGANKVVYLDFDQLIAANIKESLEKNPDTKDEVQNDADHFQTAFVSFMKKYTDEGYIIVNSKALIRATTSQDITPAVLKQLGIKQ